MNVSFPRTMPWLLLSAFIAAGILAAGAVLVMQLGLTYPCPFKFLFGIPCPTCGTTRSLAALASFDVVQSLRFNPLVLIGGLGALTGYLLRRRVSWISRAGLASFIAAFLLNWIYLLLFLPR